MRKVVLGLIAFALVLMLSTAAFLGGLLVGRNTAAPLPSPTPVVPGSTVTPSPATGSPTPTPDARLNYALLQETLDLINSEFYGKIPDASKLTYGAIRGMLNTLGDPYTSFIEPDVARIINEDASGQFEGIGATVRMREDGYLEVVRPLAGQPAEKAGLKAGDLIVEVDGKSIVGMGLYEALNLIRGKAGTQVTLKVLRENEKDPLTFTITRARIEMPIVEYRMLDNGIGYISLSEFDAKATQRVDDAIKALQEQGMEALIFDLRDNPGGWLDQALGVADLFLKDGVIAIERSSDGQEQVFKAHAGDRAEAIRMVVLVNGGSASASEIVAGALQDRGRAILIGQNTLGKGSVQRPHDLSDGSQLRVTIARWFTPNDRSIHGNGLKPDIEVQIPENTPAGEDPQLQRALEYLQQGQ